MHVPPGAEAPKTSMPTKASALAPSLPTQSQHSKRGTVSWRWRVMNLMCFSIGFSMMIDVCHVWTIPDNHDGKNHWYLIDKIYYRLPKQDKHLPIKCSTNSPQPAVQAASQSEYHLQDAMSQRDAPCLNAHLGHICWQQLALVAVRLNLSDVHVQRTGRY